MAGEVSFVPDLDDHVAGQRLWVRSYWRRWPTRLAAGALAVMVALGLIAIVADISRGESVRAGATAVWPLLLFPAVYVAIVLRGWLTIPRAVRRMVGQQPALASQTQWQWDDEGLIVRSAAGSSVVRWTELHRSIADTRAIVLLPQERLLLTLPLRHLSPAQEADLRQTLARFAYRP